MKTILKTILLLVPTLAIASSLSGTPPYTGISNMPYSSGVGRIGYSGIIVSDSVGNLFFSSQFGHGFSGPIASGCNVGADFITPESFTGLSITGATLWYKNTSTCMPVQVTTSFATGTGVSLTPAPSINAPSMVSGVLEQVIGVNGIDSTYPDSGGIVLTKAIQGAASVLNYYELNGSNNYQFSFFTHLAKSHIAASQWILASAGPINLDVRNLINGNNNSYTLPALCQNNTYNRGGIKFMYAGITNIYLICNKDGASPKHAMLYRFKNSSSSFDAGQKFNSTDTLRIGEEDYKAASAKEGLIATDSMVILEQSKRTGNISYINVCIDHQPLSSCQPQTVTGITSVGNITGGIITNRISASGVDRGYAGIFVGDSNMIFKVDLDRSGNYVRYSTY